MDLTGKWVPFGKWLFNTSPIVIEGNTFIYYKEDGSVDRTRKFETKESLYMGDVKSVDLFFENDEHRSIDYMAHEENINGKTVVILSFMGMEYDGRGRIVMASFTREEDADLVDENFVSKAVECWNRRPSTPMHMGGNLNAGMFNFMMSGGPMGMADVNKPVEPIKTDEVRVEGDGWNCACGEINISGKFCPNCGCPKPRVE